MIDIINKNEEKIKQLLNDFGFQKHIRHCKQPSKDNYEKEITVIEEWNNSELAQLIVEEIIKE